MRAIRQFVLLQVLLATALSGAAGAPDTEAVEFYNTNTRHFFVTASGAEARGIAGGAAGPGWVRTGRSFQAWIDKSAAAPDAKPVHRFYSPGANSHFYTSNESESALLRNMEAAERALTGTARGWAYEGVAFHVQEPVNGTCPAGTVRLTRIYNDGFRNGEGANHRYVDDAELTQLMVERSWIREGVAFCAQAKSTGTGASLGPTTNSFDALVGTWKGDARFKKEVGDDETRVTEALQLDITADGMVAGEGFGCTFTGKVQVGDGFRSFFRGTISASGCTDAAFDGDYDRLKLERFASGILLARMKREAGETEVSIEGRLVNEASAAPPPPAQEPFAAVAGEWTGTVSFDAEVKSGNRERRLTSNGPLTLTITPAGAVSGSGFGCTLTGQLARDSSRGDRGERFGGTIESSGCAEAAFDGKFDEVRVGLDDPSRLRIRFERETETLDAKVEVEIEGVLMKP